jgi:hypothetical protein
VVTGGDGEETCGIGGTGGGGLGCMCGEVGFVGRFKEEGNIVGYGIGELGDTRGAEKGNLCSSKITLREM